MADEEACDFDMVSAGGFMQCGFAALIGFIHGSAVFEHEFDKGDVPAGYGCG